VACVQSSGVFFIFIFILCVEYGHYLCKALEATTKIYDVYSARLILKQSIGIFFLQSQFASSEILFINVVFYEL